MSTKDEKVEPYLKLKQVHLIILLLKFSMEIMMKNVMYGHQVLFFIYFYAEDYHSMEIPILKFLKKFERCPWISIL
jgi:hypothetical protein